MDLHDVVLSVIDSKKADGNHVVHDVIRQETNLPLAVNGGVEGTEHGLALCSYRERDDAPG